MAKSLLLIDIDQCVRCYACEIACKQENDLHIGPRLVQNITIGPRNVLNELYMDFVPVLCFHCDDPPCAYFCSNGAIVKRDDGVVLINGLLCNKCRLCINACPYGAIHWDGGKGTVNKCTLCVERMDNGLEPSCVQHCLSGALQFVIEEELSNIIKDQYNIRIGKVCYTSIKWKLNDYP